MRNTLVMSDLPGDLLEEILCRVPATSLKQLRSTCKQWNNLFKNGRFIRKHLDKAPKQFLNLMLNESRVCSMSVSFHGIPSVEATGELKLIDSVSSLEDQFEISQVSHCDGLLLCTDDTRIVVWNPCTGQTRWIEPNNRCYYYALGSYQDKSYSNSYKILGYSGYGFKNQELAIYEINSHSWRFLDVTCDCILQRYTDYGVSLKGNTYWFASDEKEKNHNVFLVSFDYTTERFRRLRLPYQCPDYKTASLSVVREDKLSVLLQRDNTSRTEIWVTSKIGETKVVSWSMVLAVDFPSELFICSGISFLVDAEKKVVVYVVIITSERMNTTAKIWSTLLERTTK
ncbi:probable F-box protein At5g47300 [Arabidopsis lyrata subsp. lyrata]|uniref:probable F-box protein At5g47300 n=1 Tax=Arabidopsis lyrata subsp. lyrata TaxID=81972 RepID=UPI000A29BD0D|nr:probable F-box protein At5g47300 [Arabidopsis lyrata subsp. lyrata]|eukprot:XP_020871755.1 probable F-box protein At5g47300 [Arabidopsis lyrata subsp. lyrata]